MRCRLAIDLPDGFRPVNAEVRGKKVEPAGQAQTVAIHIVPSATKTVEWRITCRLWRCR